jgi:hypothetical protein
VIKLDRTEKTDKSDLKQKIDKGTHVKILYSIYFLLLSGILLILQVAWAIGFFVGFLVSEIITFTGTKVFRKGDRFVYRDRSVENMFLGFIIIGMSVVLIYFNGDIGINVTLFGIGISIFAYSVFYKVILRLSDVRIIIYEALAE